MLKGNQIETGKFYHVVNFGIDQRIVFNDKKDVERFITLLDYYRIKNPPARFAFRKRPVARESKETPIPMVEILAYSLMPNHFHLLLRQTEDGGIARFLSKTANSYTKYFNSRNKRSGNLFEGPFAAIEIPQEMLLEISRHIHIDPLLKGIVGFLPSYPFSSFQEYLGERQGFCETNQILASFETLEKFKEFVMNKESYEASISQITNLILEKA